MREARGLLLGISFAIVLGVLPALAADKAPQDAAKQSEQDRRDRAEIEELQRKLELLTEEFERLRSGSEAEEPASAAAGDEPGRYGVGPAAARVYRTRRGVSIGGYGEGLYQRFDDELDDGTASSAKDSADALRLVLYTGYKFNDRVLLNTELEFEHGSTGKDGEVSVEFAYLDFFLRPSVNVRTGLVLVPVGLVNEIHEPTTFLGARRPDVESVILPTTWRELGAGVFGDIGPVNYRAYVTTGLDGSEFSADKGIRGGRQSGSKAAAEDLALSARVDYTGVPGLLFGISGFRGDSGQGATVGGDEVGGTVTTFDVHGEWRWRGLELRGLWADVKIDDAAKLSALAGETIGSRMRGWYAQAGYDVLAGTRFNRFQLIPFARIEEFDTQDEVAPALAGTVTGANDRESKTFGVVFKPIPQIAIKADFQNFDNAAGTAQDQFNVAVGFAF